MSLSSKNQQGIGFIPLIFIMTLLFTVISITLKIVPVYLNHSKVTAMLDQLKQEADGEKKTSMMICAVVIVTSETKIWI